MDEITKRFWAIVLGIILVITIGISVRVGVEREYNGVVEYTEKDSYLYPSTKIVMRTLGGEEIALYVYGYHNFALGEQYKIKTVAEFRGVFLVEIIVGVEVSEVN